jgi:hypothetical protein
MKTIRSYVVIVACITMASAVQAQNGARPDSSITITDSAAVAPHATVQSSIDAPSAFRRNVVAAPEHVTMIAQTHAGLGQSKALMIVGGAALVTGAIVGGKPGTIIMVGGAVVGLVGLYQYLQ